MCLSPITIINPRKYVSLRYRERYLLQVPCGHCSECATNKSNEWYFRTYYQTLETLNAGGYVLFDTLTYRNEDLPHISDFVSVPDGCDFPCFSSKHIQLFNKRLRKYCSKYKSVYTFFVASEYGTNQNCTHRPHYHILVYSDGKVEPLVLSQLISKAWQYGRTDGIPFKSANYVMNNVFTSDRFDHSLRTCRYVSKYVQKSCLFQREIENRLSTIMISIAEKMTGDWLSSVHAKRVRQRYSRLMNQFHLQSVGFGSYYLQNVDALDFDSVNTCWVPDSKKVHFSIPLPQYYKRKMYYDVRKIDGNFVWIPNSIGMLYLQARNEILKENLKNRFIALSYQAKISIDADKLTDYVLNYRGRICAKSLPSSPMDIYENVSLYNYCTLSDREHLEKLGLTRLFAGNNTIGYRYNKLFNRIKFKDFIDRFVILDVEYEKQLETLYNSIAQLSDKRQKAFELRQHLVNLYHHIGII